MHKAWLTAAAEVLLEAKGTNFIRQGIVCVWSPSSGSVLVTRQLRSG